MKRSSFENAENMVRNTKSTPKKVNRLFACAMGLVLTICAYTPNLQAQPTFAGWGNSYQYDNGFNPSVAAYGSTAVDVHNGSGGAGPLWYRVGQIVGSGSPISWGANSFQYDNGFNPSVAIYGSTVVEAHNASGASGPMWYRVGQLSGSTIAWGNSHKFGAGWNPSVALYGSTVVEVNNTNGSAGALRYRVGQVSGSKIVWGPAAKYDSGFNPSVALSGSFVVEVHNGSAAAGAMWYRVGQVSGPTTVTWSNSYNYDSGWNPKAAIYDGRGFGYYVLEVHNASENLGPMWSHWGPAGSSTITFEPSFNYDNGLNPSVAISSGFNAPVEVHNGDAGLGPLWYHSGDIQIIQ